MTLGFDEVHRLIGDRWRDVLLSLGIPEASLSRKNVPCPDPACGGTDRFTFDNRHKRGDWFCRRCGSGDAFNLLANVHGWKPAEALREVIAVAGLANIERRDICPGVSRDQTRHIDEPQIAQPSRRVRDLLRTSCAPHDVADVVHYLKSRHVWPLPKGCALRGHVGVDYFDDDRNLVGRYPAVIAPVVDVAGSLVTVHATYIENGQKLAGYEPRKLLGKLTGRLGCAVRLAPATDVLGIAEGVETALAAMRLHKIPTWAALNAALLAKFEPPPGVARVLIFADNDSAGLTAAWHLRDRLTIPCELRVPPAPHKDWNDAFAAEVARHA